MPGPLVLRLGGLRLMYWRNNTTEHLSPPVWNILGWNCLGFAFKPPGLVFVGISANSANSRPSSPFMILKSSSLIPWCSCLPRRPNCWVSSHRIVWVKDSGVLPPSFSLFQKISSSSSDSSTSAGGNDLSNDAPIRVIGPREPEICTKMLKKLSENSDSKFPAITPGCSMVKIARLDDPFLEAF